MNELQVVEQVEVLVPLDRYKAEVLDGRIRRLAKQAGEQLVQVGRLLDEAQAGQVHETLGFPSWTAYVADALGGQLQLSGEARQAMVALMAGEGMSERAIAQATGASKTTVHRDLKQVVHCGPPASGGQSIRDAVTLEPRTRPTPAAVLAEQEDAAAMVTGMDGKQYRKPKPKDKGDRPAPQRRRRTARKTVEQMAIAFGNYAVGVAELDPADVESDERLHKEIKTIVDSIGAVQKFVDSVKPARQQLRTVYRNKAAALNALYQEMTKMHLDERWFKAQFTETDADALRLLITGLQQEHEYLMRKVQRRESADTPAQPEAITDAVTQ